MPSRIAALAIDAADPRLVADFWCPVLDWQVIATSSEGGISLAARDGSGPQIDVFSVPEHKSGKNRLHLDLRADGVSTDEELNRLFGLGARRADVGQTPDAPWVVLADPEGNEFCLLRLAVQELGEHEKPRD